MELVAVPVRGEFVIVKDGHLLDLLNSGLDLDDIARVFCVTSKDVEDIILEHS